MNPYVVSRDIHLLLSQWGREQGFTIPTEAIAEARHMVDEKLRQIFPHVEMIDEDELINGISRLSSTQGYPVVSLDRIYTHAKWYIDLTRAVDTNLKDVGLATRDTNSSPEAQVKKLTKLLWKENIDTITLVDDVIFSGSMMLWLIRQLQTQHIRVSSVIAGVTIGEGHNCLMQKKVKIQSVYNFETVIDEICERDFFPGVPFAGRTVLGEGKHGAPYILPFGLPGKWASIPPEHEHSFSQTCLESSIQLFTAISQASDRQVLCHDLAKIPLGCSPNGSPFVQELQKIAATL